MTTTQGLEVLGIAKGSPAEGKLKVGDRVIAIQGNSEPVNIDYKFLIDPTTLPNLKQYDHFFVQQQAAHNILLQNEIKLILADGSERIIAPRY